MVASIKTCGILFLLVLGSFHSKLINLEESTSNSIKDSDCRIFNCIECHKGFMGQACDKCLDTWGVEKKAVGDDLCVDCNSVMPNCTNCSNLRIWWNCLACKEGYRANQDQFGNDSCIKVSVEED